MFRQNALKIRSWADYDHIYSIIKSTQLLYMLLCFCWLPNSNMPEIFHNSTTIAFYLNYTKGL